MSEQYFVQRPIITDLDTLNNLLQHKRIKRTQSEFCEINVFRNCFLASSRESNNREAIKGLAILSMWRKRTFILVLQPSSGQ